MLDLDLASKRIVSRSSDREVQAPPFLWLPIAEALTTNLLHHSRRHKENISLTALVIPADPSTTHSGRIKAEPGIVQRHHRANALRETFAAR